MAQILIVDDEPVVRSALRRVLEHAGHAVTSASGGYEAIRRLDAGLYDAVLTDIQMPEGDGLEVLLHAKQHHPRIPVITMSGVEEGPLLEAAIGLGARATLTKPFGVDELHAALRAILPGGPARPE